jgi:hypothetical protein
MFKFKFSLFSTFCSLLHSLYVQYFQVCSHRMIIKLSPRRDRAKRDFSSIRFTSHHFVVFLEKGFFFSLRVWHLVAWVYLLLTFSQSIKHKNLISIESSNWRNSPASDFSSLSSLMNNFNWFCRSLGFLPFFFVWEQKTWLLQQEWAGVVHARKQLQFTINFYCLPNRQSSKYFLLCFFIFYFFVIN